MNQLKLKRAIEMYRVSDENFLDECFQRASKIHTKYVSSLCLNIHRNRFYWKMWSHLFSAK